MRRIRQDLRNICQINEKNESFCSRSWSIKCYLPGTFGEIKCAMALKLTAVEEFLEHVVSGILRIVVGEFGDRWKLSLLLFLLLF